MGEKKDKHWQLYRNKLIFKWLELQFQKESAVIALCDVFIHTVRICLCVCVFMCSTCIFIGVRSGGQVPSTAVSMLCVDVMCKCAEVYVFF